MNRSFLFTHLALWVALIGQAIGSTKLTGCQCGEGGIRTLEGLLHPCLFSKEVRSTTPPLLQCAHDSILTMLNKAVRYGIFTR